MAYTGYEGSDDISKAMLAKLSETVGAYLSLQTRIAAAEGDRAAALTSWIETTDNAAALRLKQQIETATAKLNEMAEKNVESIELSEDDKSKIEADMEAKKVSIKAAFDVIEKMAKTMSSDPEGVRAALSTIEDPTRSNRGRKTGSTGSSLPRVSANVTVNGGNLKNEVYDSFSKVATALNCEVEDLQKAFASAAGVEHQDIKTVTKSVTFEFQPNQNGAVYTLVTEPKTRKPRSDSKKAGETVSEEAQAEQSEAPAAKVCRLGSSTDD
jgi:hypothetical protein